MASVKTYKTYLALAAVLAGSLAMSACGDNSTRSTSTNTPSSMLGTDSAATKVGGTPVGTPAAGLDTTAPATGR